MSTTHTTMDYFVTYYCASGINLHGDQVREIYPTDMGKSAHENVKSVRDKFTRLYHAAGIKGVCVTPLYELRRYN